MTNTKETLVDWLRDAHAMETSVETMLEKQVQQLDESPVLKERIQEHLNVTRNQKERVEGLIRQLGEDPSVVKDTTMKVMSNLQQMMAGRAPDNEVKTTLGNLAVENFEIASYSSLVAAAEYLGENDVARVCREILEEEEQMAEWIRQKIPDVTQGYLAQKVTASR